MSLFFSLQCVNIIKCTFPNMLLNKDMISIRLKLMKIMVRRYKREKKNQSHSLLCSCKTFLTLLHLFSLVQIRIYYLLHHQSIFAFCHQYIITLPYISKLNYTHCYFTRLNLKKMGLLQFCLPIFLGFHRNPKQKEIFNSCEGFLI